MGRTGLVEGAGGGEVGDALVVVAEDVPEDLFGVLADRGGLADASGGAGEAEARDLDHRLAVEGVGHAHQVATVDELGVVDGAAGADDPVSRDAAGLEGGLGLSGRAGGGPGGDGGVEFVLVGQATGEGGVAGVARKVGAVEDSTETLPVAVVANGDGHPVVIAPGGVDAVGSHVGIAIAHASQDAAGELVVEQPGGEEVERALDLGVVDVLALTGAAAVVEGGKEGGEGEAGGDGIGVGAEGAGRGTLG